MVSTQIQQIWARKTSTRAALSDHADGMRLRRPQFSHSCFRPLTLYVILNFSSTLKHTKGYCQKVFRYIIRPKLILFFSCVQYKRKNALTLHYSKVYKDKVTNKLLPSYIISTLYNNYKSPWHLLILSLR